VAARSEARIVLDRSKTGIVGSNPTSAHLRHACPYAFILFVLSCVQVAALRQADARSTGSYRQCDQETEKAAKV
jgi:hypothetical protein